MAAPQWHLELKKFRTCYLRIYPLGKLIVLELKAWTRSANLDTTESMTSVLKFR